MLRNDRLTTPELEQLCGSAPFRFACRHGLVQRSFPAGPQREIAQQICDHCGTDHQPHPPVQATSSPHLEHYQMSLARDNEETHEALGLPSWTAPYAWE